MGQLQFRKKHNMWKQNKLFVLNREMRRGEGWRDFLEEFVRAMWHPLTLTPLPFPTDFKILSPWAYLSEEVKEKPACLLPAQNFPPCAWFRPWSWQELFRLSLPGAPYSECVRRRTCVGHIGRFTLRVSWRSEKDHVCVVVERSAFLELEKKKNKTFVYPAKKWPQ